MLDQFFSALGGAFADVEAASDNLVAEHLVGLAADIVVGLINSAPPPDASAPVVDSDTALANACARIADALRAKLGATPMDRTGAPSAAGTQADQVAALQAENARLAAALAASQASSGAAAGSPPPSPAVGSPTGTGFPPPPPAGTPA